MSTATLIEPKTATDIDLLAAISLQADDRETAISALEELHRRYSSMFLGVAMKRQAHGVDPDSVVSKTFLRVWEKAGSFDSAKRNQKVSRENAAKNWIFQILGNHINSEIRDKAALEEVSLFDGFGDAETGGEPANDEEHAADAAGSEQFAVSDRLANHEREEICERQMGQMSMLQELLDLLPERDRRILELSACYIEPNPPFRCLIPKEQLSYLARQIGVAPSSVKVLRGRAYEKLRKLAEPK